MTDLLLPPWISAARAGIRYIDSTGMSRGEFTGALKTASKGGDRLSASLEFSPTATSSADVAMQRAALMSFLVELRGRQNRAYLFDRANRIRGSIQASELLTNSTFDNGTTGWTSSAQTSLSVADRVIRATRVAVGSSDSAIQHTSAIAMTQYAPYVGRALVLPGSGAYASGFSVAFGASLGSSSYAEPAAATFGFLTTVFTAPATSAYFSISDFNASGLLAGNHFLVPYTSVSRCLLVDNAPNLFTQSGAMEHADWTKTSMSHGGNGTGPDGSVSSADQLVENSITDTRHFGQSKTVASSAADYCIATGALKATRDFLYLEMLEATGNHAARAWFNLNTGAVGTVNVSGANWTNPRAFIVSLGNGWYYCALVARKANAATTIYGRVGAANVDGVSSYLGNGSNAIYAYLPTFAASSVPLRLSLTTTAASSGSNQPGSALYLKGLPASTNGLLLRGDQFEVITSRGSELKFVTAALNSNAAGLGNLKFEPPLRGVPADSAPIIIHQPMGKFVFTGDLIGWDNEPGIITRASAEFEEA